MGATNITLDAFKRGYCMDFIEEMKRQVPLI